MKKIILSVMCLYASSVFASQEIDVDFSQPQKPNQIAVGKSVAVSLADGVWTVAGDKAVWSYSFNTPNATSMGFSASADLPAGSVVKAGNDFLTRTYTTDLINGGVLNGVPVKGNTLTITVEVPAGQQGSASFAINNIYAGSNSVQPKADFTVKALDSTAPTSPLNYACAVQASTLNAERSTVDILINEGQDTIQCTGNLVNDVPSSKKHNILTAAHCGTSNSWNASQVTVLWGRQNQCALGIEDASSIDGPMSTGYTTTAVVTQAKVLNNVGTWDGDMWVMQSPTAPPLGSNPYWAGVNAVLYPSSTLPALAEYGENEPAIGLMNVYNVSHPLGNSKSYAFSSNPVIDGDECVGLSCGQDDTATYDVNFNTGLLEEGSSGSALYDQNNLLIGTLSGCGNSTNGTTTFICDFANIAENWLGPQTGGGLNGKTYYQTVKEVLDPANTGTLTYAGLEDTSRTDNLTVFLNSDVVTASAGGTVNLSLFTSEATGCIASSSPAVSGWNGALTVNNGNSVATAVTIPSSSQYTLSVSCVNAANYTVTQDVVINSTGGSSSGGSSGGSSGSSSGGTSGGSSSGSSSGGSTSSSGSGGGSGGGGGAFDLFTLFPLLGMMLLRKKQA